MRTRNGATRTGARAPTTPRRARKARPPDDADDDEHADNILTKKTKYRSVGPRANSLALSLSPSPPLARSLARRRVHYVTANSALRQLTLLRALVHFSLPRLSAGLPRVKSCLFPGHDERPCQRKRECNES